MKLLMNLYIYILLRFYIKKYMYKMKYDISLIMCFNCFYVSIHCLKEISSFFTSVKLNNHEFMDYFIALFLLYTNFCLLLLMDQHHFLYNLGSTFLYTLNNYTHVIAIYVWGSEWSQWGMLSTVLN